MNKKKTKISKEIKINKKSVRRNYSNQTDITLIALVVTIVVLLILAGVTINAVFSDRGIIKKAQDAQNKANESIQKDMEQINALENWLNENTGESNNDKEVNISTLVGKGAVTKNTKAVDTYGNKITIPKGFKVLEHGTEAGSATYTYSGDTIPAVQDGIVIENGTDKNQFVWVPVGTIKNKDNTTNTITLGRYSDFTAIDGKYTPAQSAENYNAETPITITSGSSSWNSKELSTFRDGSKSNGSENATARNLAEFISTSLSNGGYYIARFEASKTKTTSKIYSKYNQKVLTDKPQPEAASLAREMYGEVKENNELIYASDLVNSYAWDTAIIFIQTYSTETDASNYASQNKSASFANTGINNDKYCNIWDMSGNVKEWTTEYSTHSYASYWYPCVHRGGYYFADRGGAIYYTSYRGNNRTSDCSTSHGLRPLLYVK